MRATLIASIIVMTGVAVACGGSGQPPATSGAPARGISAALVTAAEMRPPWRRYTPPAAHGGGPGVCNPGVRGPALKPIATESTAWAEDPADGPIFGERIELYSSAKQAVERVQRPAALPLPCEWNEDGTRWRATREPSIGLGDGGFAYLITSLDTSRPGFNYEIGIRRGRAVLLVVVNTRQPAAPLVQHLVQRAWDRADRRLHGV